MASYDIGKKTHTFFFLSSFFGAEDLIQGLAHANHYSDLLLELKCAVIQAAAGCFKMEWR
jgi:hypothetical protein